METFHSLLKRAELYLKPYLTLIEVQAAIGWYINFIIAIVFPMSPN
ncbi:hypothetical protein [Leuconostoc mesenteroides]|nr:hypothetical protein [Leuconostoc mesenteroides]